MVKTKIEKIKHIRVTTGFDCDCKCHYCTQRNSNISDRFTRNGSQLQTLYYLIKNKQVLDNNLVIELEGGEPLLHIDIIKNVVLLCEQLKAYDINVNYLLVSNCHKLNTHEGRALIDWLSKQGCKFSIFVSFDHDQKNPRYLTDDTYTFIKNCGATIVRCSYVIEGKYFLNRANQNITFLKSKGLYVNVQWNFLKYGELSDKNVRNKFCSLVKETGNNHGKQEFVGTPSTCSWIGIGPDGRIYGCHEANFGVADFSVGEDLEKNKCSICDIHDFCKQCIVRKSIYGESLCYYVRANYELLKGGD